MNWFSSTVELFMEDKQIRMSLNKSLQLLFPDITINAFVEVAKLKSGGFISGPIAAELFKNSPLMS